MPIWFLKKSMLKASRLLKCNEDVIHLFKQYVLPQFNNARKIKIIKADAFEFARKHMPKGNYDFVFTDLWHDVSDGIDMYLKMKQYESIVPILYLPIG